MRKSTNATCLATLRSILGPDLGHEERFANIVGLSRSWLKKASCGKISISENAAALVSHATGIDKDWLYRGNNSTPPTDKWGNPYTRAFGEQCVRNLLKTENSQPFDPMRNFAKCIFDLLEIFTSANDREQGRICLQELEEFIFKAKRLYGSRRPSSSDGIFSGLIHGLTQRLEAAQSREVKPPVKNAS